MPTMNAPLASARPSRPSRTPARRSFVTVVAPPSSSACGRRCHELSVRGKLVPWQDKLIALKPVAGQDRVQRPAW
jgi:hypothetical protein